MPRIGSEAYSLVVLGRGAAAVTAAREAADQGVQVALLVPETASPDTPAPDTREAGDYVRTIREHQTRQGLRPPPLPVDEPRIDILHGTLRFYRYRTVLVGGVEVRFRRALAATGTVPGPIGIAGADAAAPLRPDDLDRLDAPPRRLAVIGGDGDACFWAQQLRRLGSEVHLIAAAPRLLESADPHAVEIVREQLDGEGVRIHVGCEEIHLDRVGYRRGVLIRQGRLCEKVLVDEVLVCSTPRPNLAGLALETAAVSYRQQGIAVDDWLRTSERHVYAAGGVCGPEFASPEAEQGTGRLAARNAVGWLPERLSRCLIPRCTSTEPPIIELGLLAAEEALGSEATQRRIEFREPRAGQWGGSGRGCIAVRLDRKGRLLHATLVATAAEELALPLMLLMNRRLPIAALNQMVACRSGRGRLLLALARR